MKVFSNLKKTIKLTLRLPRLVKLLWGLFKDGRVPPYLKVLALGALSYLAAPLDIVPDFIPASGYLDDLIVIFLVAQRFIATCPLGVVQEHLEKVKLKESDFDQDLKVIKEQGGKLFELIKKNLDKITRKYSNKYSSPR